MNRMRFLAVSTSIHAPHAWGDSAIHAIKHIDGPTSIHAPHAWGDELIADLVDLKTNFNPRPTCVGRLRDYFLRYFHF